MPHLDSVPEPWRSFLRELDEAVAEEVRLICMEALLSHNSTGFRDLRQTLTRSQLFREIKQRSFASWAPEAGRSTRSTRSTSIL
jgi:hypothetical protein